MAYRNKLIDRAYRNYQILSNNIYHELVDYEKIAYHILHLDLLPLILVVVLSFVMTLPQELQDLLKFHFGNPSWWQYITAAFVHQNFDHFSSNIIMLILILFLQLLFVYKMGEEKRYQLLLLITLFVVPITTLLIQSYYGANGFPIYKYGSTSCGISGVIFALFAFSPFIILTYYSKVIGKKLLNQPILITVSLYVLLGFQVSACIVVPTMSMFIFMIVLLLAFLIACLFVYYKQVGDFKMVTKLAINEYFSGLRFLTSILIVLLVILFLIMPWLLLSTQFIVNGTFVDFIAHFMGILIGLILGYWMFSTLSFKTP